MATVMGGPVAAQTLQALPTPGTAGVKTPKPPGTGGFMGVRLPLRNYVPGMQVVVPDPWGRPMRLQFSSFAAPTFHGSVFLTVDEDVNGLPRASRVVADAFAAGGNMVFIYQQIIDPSGHQVWRAPPPPPRTIATGTGENRLLTRPGH